MKVTEPEDAQRYAVLYQATIAHAVGGAPELMARLVAHTRAALRDLEGRSADRRERDRLTASRRLLNQYESATIERFSEELKSAFARVASRERALPASAAQPHFDQLAGMDAAQVRASVETARVRHAVQIAADHALAELNQLICAMLGLEQVQLESNPLRPAVYVDAVTEALSHLPITPVVRQGWISLMSGALGQELDIYYRQLCVDLHERGIGAGEVKDPSTVAGDAARSDRAPTGARDGHALTLERLRQLLVHAPALRDEVANQYRRPSDQMPVDAQDTVIEPGPTAFQPTVPAAFDAARDMNQLDRVVQRIEALGTDGSGDALLTQRETLRRAAHGLDQTLGLEVVALMVDNIRHDPRLLGPVQELVAGLEPALLQLALIDPRFFSHKHHPARRLLHEITHRSIAFESVDSRGFSGFMEPLREVVAPLSTRVIDNAEPFDQVLSRLVALWDEPQGREKRQIARAVQALQQAEQRSALAATMVREVLARPDAVLVPSGVLDFLCGPWAQVVAHARMTDRGGADDPGGYAAVIDDLMWSAQPALTREDGPALAAMAPGLVQRLSAGLLEVGYQPGQHAAFFELLDALHRRGLDAMAFADTEWVDVAVPAKHSVAQWQDQDSAWLVPAEARVSGFIDVPIEPVPPRSKGFADQLVHGVWVALMAEESWSRTRLAWISPNGSLLLFCDALGFIQSLTKASCLQLYTNGHLRIISTDPVEDALDAVAELALRNSVDIRF